jgi:hypothetical protein
MPRPHPKGNWISRWTLACFSGALVSLAMAIPVAAAPQTTTTAPCGSFKQLPDGKWTVVNPINIQHGNMNTMLSPGTVVSIGMQVSGVDLYAALQKSCARGRSSN